VRLWYVDPLTETSAPPAGAESQVTALFQAHATGLVRLAMLMLGDQPAAEDVVQDAFFGLYRRWGTLSDPDRAVAYARSSVLNGCRDALRKRSRKIPAAPLEPDAESAEARALLGEEHREVLAALRRLPGRQREAVVLRHCLGLPEHEVAEAMKVSRGTVKSASHRGLAALARILKEAQ
jgi:RNA polymerase sigma-70 factor (sigma-E family)